MITLRYSNKPPEQRQRSYSRRRTLTIRRDRRMRQRRQRQHQKTGLALHIMQTVVPRYLCKQRQRIRIASTVDTLRILVIA